MFADVTPIVLCAALFHAIWNGLVKGGKDPLLESMLIAMTCFLIGFALVFFLPLPDVKSFPFIAGSIVLQTFYFLLLSKSYQVGDFSAVYPIVRGLPPLIVALASIFIISEPLSLYGGIGVCLISAGILALELGNKVRSYRMLGFAVATAFVIASYTVVDGIGARLSGHSTSFLAWFFVLHSPLFVMIVCVLRSKEICLSYVSQHWKKGLLAGTLSFLAYAIVLWAVTKAPIAYVSALRETSVLFASLIAVFFLGEPLRKSRILSAILIFLGICTIKLG